MRTKRYVNTINEYINFKVLSIFLPIRTQYRSAFIGNQNVFAHNEALRRGVLHTCDTKSHISAASRVKRKPSVPPDEPTDLNKERSEQCNEAQ